MENSFQDKDVLSLSSSKVKEVICQGPNRFHPWQKLCIEACVDSLQPYGDVLEVGFSSSFSSSYIQTFFPKKHVIIEESKGNLKLAKEWSSHHRNVLVVEKKCSFKAFSGIYDAIFFDGLYPRDFSFSNDHILLNILKVLKDRSGCDDLFKQTYPLKEINPNLYYGLIDPEKKIGLKSIFKHMLYAEKGKELQSFLESCLCNNMRRGSRFSCFITTMNESFPERRCFDKIITNPFIDYQERMILLDSFNKKALSNLRAFIITITKR